MPAPLGPAFALARPGGVAYPHRQKDRKIMSLELIFKKSDDVEIKERQQKGEYCDSVSLYDGENEVELQVLSDNEGDVRPVLRLSTSHAVDPATERGFHVYLSFTLDRGEIQLLYEFLGLLIRLTAIDPPGSD
jgi:hypothetical protein